MIFRVNLLWQPSRRWGEKVHFTNLNFSLVDCDIRLDRFGQYFRTTPGHGAHVHNYFKKYRRNSCTAVFIYLIMFTLYGIFNDF